MSAENVAVIRTFFQLFDEDRLEEMKDLLAEDFSWTYHGPKSLPWAGEYEGEAGFDRFFEIVHELIDVEECVAYEYLDAGDDVVVLGYSKTRILANDARYEAQWINIFRLRDGRIARYLDLFDTASVVEALQAPPG